MDTLSPPGLHVGNAPSSRLVFSCLMAGVVSFVLLNGATVWFSFEWGGFYANPRFLAWVHAAVLLWLNPVIFGVLFQFLPVVLEVRPAGRRLVIWQMVFYFPGAIGMIACFWIGRLDWPLHSFATFVWIGLLFFLWIMIRALREVRAWTLTSKCLLAASIHLFITIMLGMFLSIHLYYPMVPVPHLTIMKVHALFGMAGWFFMVIMGVSFKLLPMFLLSHGYRTTAGKAAFLLANAGLACWLFGVFPKWPSSITGAGVVFLAGAAGAFLAQVFEIHRCRNRIFSDANRRHGVRKTGYPLRFAMGAFVLLGVAALIGVVAALWPDPLPPGLRNRLILAYGAVYFLGFLHLLTLSLLYKIVPLLIWLRKFSQLAGGVRTPKVDALVPARSAVAQLLAYSAGAGLSIFALVMDLPSWLLAGNLIIFASSLWLAVNLLLGWKNAVPLGAVAPIPSCARPSAASTSL